MRSADARLLASLCSLALVAASPGCGGGSHSSSTGPGNNTQPITVNSGPGNNYVNGVFTTVKVCAPGSSNCQNVSGVLVDTGSFGLRILSSALGPLNSSLPQQRNANGDPSVECAQFVNSVLWGPVKTADLTMAGEKASAVPIQVIDSSVAPIPAACKAIGPAEQDLAGLGANGILGIGFFISDCGGACATAGSGNPGFYYSCGSSGCTVSPQSISQQVQQRRSGSTTGSIRERAEHQRITDFRHRDPKQQCSRFSSDFRTRQQRQSEDGFQRRYLRGISRQRIQRLFLSECQHYRNAHLSKSGKWILLPILPRSSHCHKQRGERAGCNQHREFHYR